MPETLGTLLSGALGKVLGIGTVVLIFFTVVYLSVVFSGTEKRFFSTGC